MNPPQVFEGGIGGSGVTSPYPGLRPFQRKESLIFFGRDGQVDQMLELLRRVRFLGVVGSSGCGKSSLVKAGFFPALHAGFMLSSKVPWAESARFPNWVASRWFTVDMRPGAHPFRSLARGLMDSGVLGTTWDLNDPGSLPALAARLQAGPRQLIKLWQHAEASPTGNLLILADQFEELFRFRDGDNFGMAQSFVDLLLQLAAQDDWPIYIAITMRSDFLGECAQFSGLPEALNKGQFLVSRLTTTETRKAIESPARMFGVELDPLLMTRLLNDIGNNSDQLPLLQHALKRMWDLSKIGDASGAPDSETIESTLNNSKRTVLTLADYERTEIGGITQALSRHADELFAELAGKDENDGDKRIARVLFQALTLRDNGRDVRRPTKLGVIAKIAGVQESDVIRIVDVFRHPDCCFLMPPADTPLNGDTMLDISHESLLRQWKRLDKDWIAQESESAAEYDRMLDAVNLQEPILEGLRLDRAVKWRDTQHPTPAWAMRYDGAEKAEESLLPQCEKLISDSEEARTAREIEASNAIREKQAIAERERDLLKVQKALLAREKEAEAKRADSESQRARDAETAAAKLQRWMNLAWVAFGLATFFMMLSFYALNNAREKEIEAKIAFEKARKLEEEVKIKEDRIKDQDRTVETKTSEAKIQTEIARAADEKRKKAEQDLKELKAVSMRTPPLPEIGTAELAEASASSEVQRELEPAVMDFKSGCESYAQERQDDALLWWARASKIKNDRELRGSTLNLIGGCAARLRHTIPQDAKVTAIAVSQSGRKVAIGTVVGKIQLLKVEAGEVKGIPIILGTELALSDEQDKDVGNAIRCLAFSRDEKCVATGSSDKTVRLWDIATRKQRGPDLNHGAEVMAVQFSRDGKIVSGSWDKTAKVWEVSKFLADPPPQEVNPLQPPFLHVGGVTCLAFNPADDRRVITGCADGTARLWDVTTGKQLSSSVPHKGWVTAVAFSDNGRVVATAGQDGQVRLCRASDLISIGHLPDEQKHTDEIKTIAFSPDSRTLVTASADKTARLWDVTANGLVLKRIGVEVERDGKTTAEWKYLILRHDDAVTSVCFQDNLRVITGSRDKTARLWGVETGELLRSPFRHDAGVNRLAIISDERSATLITGSLDGTARFWDLDNDSYNWVNKESPPIGAVLSLDVKNGATVDHEIIVTGMLDGAAPIWSIPATVPITKQMKRGGRVNAVAFSPKQPSFATITGGLDRSISLWNLDRTELKWETPADKDVYCIAFINDGTKIATGGADRRIRIWNADTGELAQKSDVHDDSVRALAYDHNAETETIYSGCDDGTLWVWDLKANTLKKLDTRHQERVAGLALSFDDTTLLTGSWDKTAFLVDVKRREEPSATVIKSILKHAGPVRAVAFTKDARSVATGVGHPISSKSSEFHFWDSHTGQERSETIYVTHQLADLMFTPNGRGLVVGGGYVLDKDSQVGYVRRWRVAPPAIDGGKRLMLSVEVRTGKRLDETGMIHRLNYDEWKTKVKELSDDYGGSCDAPKWNQYDDWNREK